MAKRRNRAMYAAELIQDGEEDANIAQRHLGYFPSLRSAVDAVNEAKDPARGWFTGGVYYGFLWEPVPGKSPEYFEEDEREQSWFVGTDGKAVR